MNKIYEEGYIQDIADAIRTKNGTQNTYTVSQMATAIENIPSGVGTIEINENGTYNVSQYAEADVVVPQPYGDIQITTNGTHDVADYENAIVNVSVPLPNNELILSDKMFSLQPLANMRDSIVEINRLDCTYMQTVDAGFSFCSTLEKASLINTSSITSMQQLFGNCSVLEEADLGSPSSCTNFAGCFANCLSLSDIEGLDFSSVTSESGLNGFVENCVNLSDNTLNSLMSEIASMQNYQGYNKSFRNLLKIDNSITDARLQSLSAYPDLISAGWTL